MPSLLEDFVKAFIPLFVAIDPIGLAAVFLALGQGTPPDLRRRIARQATWTGGGVVCACAAEAAQARKRGRRTEKCMVLRKSCKG